MTTPGSSTRKYRLLVKPETAYETAVTEYGLFQFQLVSK